jgi:hypothetical protein
MATSGRGSGVVGYNVQIAVDTEHHLIVHNGDDMKKKPPRRGRLRLPHIVLTQDALDVIGHDIERRRRAGEKFPTYEDYKRRREELIKQTRDRGR